MRSIQVRVIIKGLQMVQFSKCFLLQVKVCLIIVRLKEHFYTMNSVAMQYRVTVIQCNSHKYRVFSCYIPQEETVTNYLYSQFTDTLAVLFTAPPIPLSAVQRYVPALFLLLGNSYRDPLNRTLLSLPLLNTFVQVKFGGGTPSAVHVSTILPPPSTTTRSPEIVTSDGGSVEEVKSNLK